MDTLLIHRIFDSLFILIRRVSSYDKTGITGRYFPHFIFYCLLYELSFDHMVCIDWFISEETCFTEAFLVYLEIVTSDFESFVASFEKIVVRDVGVETDRDNEISEGSARSKSLLCFESPFIRSGATIYKSVTESQGSPESPITVRGGNPDGTRPDSSSAVAECCGIARKECKDPSLVVNTVQSLTADPSKEMAITYDKTSKPSVSLVDYDSDSSDSVCQSSTFCLEKYGKVEVQTSLASISCANSGDDYCMEYDDIGCNNLNKSDAKFGKLKDIEIDVVMEHKGDAMESEDNSPRTDGCKVSLHSNALQREVSLQYNSSHNRHLQGSFVAGTDYVSQDANNDVNNDVNDDIIRDIYHEIANDAKDRKFIVCPDQCTADNQSDTAALVVSTDDVTNNDYIDDVTSNDVIDDTSNDINHDVVDDAKANTFVVCFDDFTAENQNDKLASAVDTDDVTNDDVIDDVINDVYYDEQDGNFGGDVYECDYGDDNTTDYLHEDISLDITEGDLKTVGTNTQNVIDFLIRLRLKLERIEQKELSGISLEYVINRILVVEELFDSYHFT